MQAVVVVLALGGGAGDGIGDGAGHGDGGIERCTAEPGLFITGQVDADASGAPSPADQAFVFSSWQKGIEGWRFNPPTDHPCEAGLRDHLVMDRTLLRNGEVVSNWTCVWPGCRAARWRHCR